MKVIVCIPCLLTGGTEVQTVSLVKALVSVGHHVTTVCYFEYASEMVKRYTDVGCDVICLSSGGNRTHGICSTIGFLYHGLKKTIKQVQPDVVHVQYMAPGAIPILLLRILGVKTIIATAHTAADIYSRIGLWSVRFIQRYLLTAFTCITERAEQSFFGSSERFNKEMSLTKKGNHFTIYNNLPDYIQIAEAPRDFKKPVTIGVVSRLEIIKGMDLVLPAFEKIHQQYSDTRLFVVGDGFLRKSMERQMNDMGLDKAIEFLGRLPHERLQDYYDKIDILLIPSRSEGFGLTAIEGMARGCVVIASNIGGLPEVVKDGVSGLLHKTEDVQDIYEKVVGLLSNTQQTESFSKQACLRAKEFTYNQYQTQISSLYQKIEKTCLFKV